jgi:hypothetical protein
MLKKGVYSNSLFLQKQVYLCLFLDFSKFHNDKLHLYLISNFNNFKWKAKESLPTYPPISNTYVKVGQTNILLKVVPLLILMTHCQHPWYYDLWLRSYVFFYHNGGMYDIAYHMNYCHVRARAMSHLSTCYGQSHTRLQGPSVNDMNNYFDTLIQSCMKRLYEVWALNDKSFYID